MDKIKRLQEIIDEAKMLVFFGGAGVSTASGLKDFKGANGLYKEITEKVPEYYLSARCFYTKPDVFFEFYKKNMNCLKASFNIIHAYLTKLEENGKLKAIITQNIDGLHQLAGSKNVLEIHGTVHQNHCISCNKKHSAADVFSSQGIPTCECGGIIKPDVVLYGEMLSPSFSTAQYYISKADALIVAGTSLTVEPASSLVTLFKGKNLIILNYDETPIDNLATLVIHDKLENVFEKLYEVTNL